MAPSSATIETLRRILREEAMRGQRNSESQLRVQMIASTRSKQKWDGVQLMLATGRAELATEGYKLSPFV
jgi:hypothetical protein